MAEFRVRVVRVCRVVQDAFVTVQAESKQEALDVAYEQAASDVEWRTQDSETQNFEVDEGSIKEIA